MWPFRRKSKSTERISRAPNELNLPGDEMTQIFRKTVRDLGEDEALELVFERCDFKLARDEIADFFQVVNAEGRREGKVAYYKQEFVRGWQVFSANPSADTARAWLKAAPDYKDMIQSYLVECCPGGKFAFYSRLLKH